MTKRRPLCICLLIVSSACSTGSGSTVLPSPVGDAAVGKACRDALPDIIPAAPITTDSAWRSEGMGSAADALEVLRMGFARASFTATSAQISSATALASGDTNRWSQAPLSGQAGWITLEVVARGDTRCAAFEREVEGQRNSSDPKAATDDPMKFWTDTRYPAAPPEGRNWCLGVVSPSDSGALRYERRVTTSREGQTNVSVALEVVTNGSSDILARRTQVWMTRPSFPIGISSVATGCDGRTIGPVLEFFGPAGIALRAALPPTLINK